MPFRKYVVECVDISGGPMNYEEFCRVWIPLGESLLGTAAGILASREDAEDALQDLYVKLWQQRDTLDSVYNPPAYATRVLKNICIDRIRAKRPDVALPPELEGFESGDSSLEDRERIRGLASAILKLPATQRRILEMRTLQGLSYEEMAKITGKNQLTLRVLLSRARKTLRKYGES